MTKIRTAKEVIFQKQITAKHPNFTIEEISEMMQEYANQFLDRAADGAGYDSRYRGYYLPKDSILRIKEMVK